MALKLSRSRMQAAEDRAKVNLKLETSISYARTSGRCDIAFRWDDDGLLEFGRKPLLSAPPCRMLDMCANMRGLQPGH